MSRTPPLPKVDLRGFRWPLHPLERKLDGALETARLALALLQRRHRELEQVAVQWKAHQAEQERSAAECVRGDPRLRAHALGYLGTLQHRLAQAGEQASELHQRIAAARGDCVDRQRQLSCVQALRQQAQQQHAQAQLRREAREADAAWLVLQQQRSASTLRGGSRRS